MTFSKTRKRRLTKCAACAILCATILSSGGCTTVLNGDFCDVYQPVYLDYERDTPETIRQVDANNVVWDELCR